MSDVALFGAVELGLVYAFVALGVYLSFRVLDFPDLTVDGSFPLGGAVAAVLIVGGGNPWLATLAAMGAAALAGLVTATLNVRFRILHLLASILTMIALFSVNLRVMGAPNVAILTPATILTPFYGHGVPDFIVRPLLLAVFAVICVVGVTLFLKSDFGLAMRAAGANVRMARAQGIATELHVYVGLALSNALYGLAGAMFAQTNGFADVTAGIGTIMIGLAAVIIGETLFRTRRIGVALTACVLGAVIYRVAVQIALSSNAIGLQPSDLNMITAILVALALVIKVPRLRLWKPAS